MVLCNHFYLLTVAPGLSFTFVAINLRCDVRTRNNHPKDKTLLQFLIAVIYFVISLFKTYIQTCVLCDTTAAENF